MNEETADQAGMQDEAANKGAVEDDGRHRDSESSLSGQIGHRDQDAMLKDNDTDFPEPDAKAEHSGGPPR